MLTTQFTWWHFSASQIGGGGKWQPPHHQSGQSGQISKHLCKHCIVGHWIQKRIFPEEQGQFANHTEQQNNAWPFFCFVFTVMMFYDVVGEPQGQRSVHLSDQRLQTHGAQSHPDCQRSVKLPSVREEICLSPGLSIITTGAILECVSIPIAPSADQTAFKLSSSHLSLNTVSWLDIRTMLCLDCLWENRYAEFP